MESRRCRSLPSGFETSSPSLFEAIHPGIPADGPNGSRIDMPRTLRQIGYEIGSGVMVGVPGQSIDDLARDLLEFRNLDLDMTGCGPYLPHPDTPLGKIYDHPETEMARYGILPAQGQVENTNEMAFKAIAIARILSPDANNPSTTAIATIDGNSGRVNGLSRGANVMMPNLTPMQYRDCYEIYPQKAATRETALQTHQMALRQIESIGPSRLRSRLPSACLKKAWQKTLNSLRPRVCGGRCPPCSVRSVRVGWWIMG